MAAIATLSLADAQTIEKPLKSPNLLPVEGSERVELRGNQTNNRRDVYANWYEPWGAVYGSVAGQGINRSIFIMSPDSLPVAISDNDGAKDINHGRVHMIGSVVDPKDALFGFTSPSVTPMSKFNSYSVDSIYFNYGYYRNADSMMVNGNMEKIIDTAYLQIYNQTSLRLAGLRWTGGDNEGESELYGHPSTFDADRSMATTSLQTIPILLDESDSSLAGPSGWFSKQMIMPLTGVNITAGDPNESTVMGYSLTFHPMKKPVFGDTLYNSYDNNFPDIHDGISNKHNYFGAIIWSNSGDDILQSDNYNNMFLVNTFLKYEGAGSASIFDRYYPGLIYDARFYLYSGVHLTTQNLSVDDIDANGYGLGQAYPNPVTSGDEINIDFELGNSATAVVSLMDINGKVIETKEVKGNQGTNTTSLSTGNLAPGIYMYSLNADNFSATKKFIVK